MAGKTLGGYVMLDCTGLDLTKGSQTTQEISGLFARIKDAYASKKLVIAENCAWDNTILSPVACFINPYSSSMFIVTASTLQVRVTSDDEVTVWNMGNTPV